MGGFRAWADRGWAAGAGGVLGAATVVACAVSCGSGAGGGGTGSTDAGGDDTGIGADTPSPPNDGSGEVGSFCDGCACVPGTSSCNGQQVTTCGPDGQYLPPVTCLMGTVCSAGRCDDKRCPDETDPMTGENELPIHAWPRYRHDNRNSGWTPAVVADHPQPLRRIFIGGTAYDNQTGLASGPVVDQNGIVYVGGGELDNNNGAYYAFDAGGNPLFKFLANRKTGLSTPAVRKDQTSFVASGGDLLFAITPTGMQLWSYTTSMGTDGDPIVTREGTIIYPSEDGSVYAFDPTGKLVWQSSAQAGPGHADSGIAESCDGRVYVGGVNGFFALDVTTGATLWSIAATGPNEAVSSSPTVTADGVMYGVDNGGMGWALDPAGKVIWSKQLGPAGATSPTHVGNLLLVVLDDGNLHALDDATGTEKWSRPVGYTLTRSVGKIAGPVIDGNLRVYINSTDGNVYAFDLSGNQLWKVATSGMAHAQLFSGGIAIANDGTMYVPGNDGFLYAIK
jgi:outer membrane protein assembly factor BamB